MGTSHEIIKSDWLEFAVDVEQDDELLGTDPPLELAFTLTMGTGFQSVSKPCANLETSRLTLDEFREVVERMNEILRKHDAVPGVW